MSSTLRPLSSATELLPSANVGMPAISPFQPDAKVGQRDSPETAAATTLTGDTGPATLCGGNTTADVAISTTAATTNDMTMRVKGSHRSSEAAAAKLGAPNAGGVRDTTDEFGGSMADVNGDRLGDKWRFFKLPDSCR